MFASRAYTSKVVMCKTKSFPWRIGPTDKSGIVGSKCFLSFTIISSYIFSVRYAFWVVLYRVENFLKSYSVLLAFKAIWALNSRNIMLIVIKNALDLRFRIFNAARLEKKELYASKVHFWKDYSYEIINGFYQCIVNEKGEEPNCCLWYDFLVVL